MTIAGAAAGKNIKHVTWPWMRKSTIMSWRDILKEELVDLAQQVLSSI